MATTYVLPDGISVKRAAHVGGGDFFKPKDYWEAVSVLQLGGELMFNGEFGQLLMVTPYLFYRGGGFLVTGNGGRVGPAQEAVRILIGLIRERARAYGDTQQEGNQS